MRGPFNSGRFRPVLEADPAGDENPLRTVPHRNPSPLPLVEEWFAPDPSAAVAVDQG